MWSAVVPCSTGTPGSTPSCATGCGVLVAAIAGSLAKGIEILCEVEPVSGFAVLSSMSPVTVVCAAAVCCTSVGEACSAIGWVRVELAESAETGETGGFPTSGAGVDGAPTLKFDDAGVVVALASGIVCANATCVIANDATSANVIPFFKNVCMLLA